MKNLKLIGIGVVFVGFIALVIWATVQADFLKSQKLDPMIVRAPENAVKSRAEDPGGMNFPHKDKKVFDLLKETSTAERVVAKEPEVKPTAKPIEPKEAKKDTAKKIIKKETPPKPAAEKPTLKKVIAAKGKWGVQLASFTDQNAAQKAATNYQSRYKTILNGLSSDIQQVDLGSKGNRYRVRFVGLHDKSSATSICNKLKQQKQGCLVISR